MEKIATDIYTLSRLREDGFTYVDKTDALYAMASGDAGAQFFIARPRRFGKSLAVSTLKSLFLGERELFRGLAIEPKWDWSKKWPVLHLDMGSMQASNVEEFRELLSDHLLDRAHELGVEGLSGSTPAVLFKRLIDALAAKSPDGRMVLLVDEYDKPLLGHLMKPDVTEFRDELKAFYSVIKTLESKQRFAFITGVSKFSKVSIFSDLNNLKDWTMHQNAATLFGYTHDEVLKYFPERIHELAEAQGVTDEGAFGEIAKWYDGYRFEENAEHVINPVSLGLCFDNGKFANYWSKTAVPTFLIDILKKHPLNFATIDITDDRLEAYEPESPDITTLLYQTGYLTIKSSQRLNDTTVYGLDFPNREVANSFTARLVPAYVGMDALHAESATFEAARALYAHDVERFVKAIKAFFANIPYDLTDRQTDSWCGQGAVSHDGKDALRTGIIYDGQSSYLITRVTGPGTLTFWWKVSCEAGGNDALRFLLDGSQKQMISGERDWAKVTVDVAGSGSHVLKWNYTKNSSVSKGQDFGWLDQLSWTAK